MRVECEEAFVLHSRPYRETSRLVDIFTRHYGRFRVVARGSRGGSARKRSLNLMPFTLLQLSWSGQSELKNLMAAESVAATPFFRGKTLYSGFYLNELMIRQRGQGRRRGKRSWIAGTDPCCNSQRMNRTIRRDFRRSSCR